MNYFFCFFLLGWKLSSFFLRRSRNQTCLCDADILGAGRRRIANTNTPLNGDDPTVLYLNPLQGLYTHCLICALDKVKNRRNSFRLGGGCTRATLPLSLTTCPLRRTGRLSTSLIVVKTMRDWPVGAGSAAAATGFLAGAYTEGVHPSQQRECRAEWYAHCTVYQISAYSPISNERRLPP